MSCETFHPDEITSEDSLPTTWGNVLASGVEGQIIVFTKEEGGKKFARMGKISRVHSRDNSISFIIEEYVFRDLSDDTSGDDWTASYEEKVHIDMVKVSVTTSSDGHSFFFQTDDAICAVTAAEFCPTSCAVLESLIVHN